MMMMMDETSEDVREGGVIELPYADNLFAAWGKLVRSVNKLCTVHGGKNMSGGKSYDRKEFESECKKDEGFFASTYTREL